MFMHIEVNDYIKENFIRKVIKKRNPDIHKGDCGRILVVAGGAGMTGAAVFSARAAMRSGAGLVYVQTPPANYPVIQTLCPEAIMIDWNEAAEHFSGDSGKNYDAVAFGPGMGTGMTAKRRLKALLLSYTGKVILDADGLNMISEDADLARFAASYSGELVITPHVGEAKRLLGPAFYANTEGRTGLALRLAEKYNAVTLLKGSHSLVARLVSEMENREETESGVGFAAQGEKFPEIWENTTGNAGMATAGSGDVLTGVIVSLMGQGLNAWDAARAGCYLHGLAGDLAREEKGEYGLIASDLVEYMPCSIKKFTL